MAYLSCVAIIAAVLVSFDLKAQPLGAEQKRFHAIYKELVETNTSHSAGDNTLAARRMARHLKDAGFADADTLVLEPFPKKGMLVARFRGDGSRKPLLLLAHLDVVEALRPDVMQVVEGLTREMWPGIPVVPAMSTGATDSRFLRNIGIHVYGVSGLFVDPADLRIHGLDERIEIRSVYAGREFMYQMVKRLAQ